MKQSIEKTMMMRICRLAGTIVLALVICGPGNVYAESSQAKFAATEKLFLEGRYQEVIDMVDRLNERQHSDKDAWYYLAGVSELKLGKYADARQSFQDIITECPGSSASFDAYVGLGDAYLLEGNPAAAITVYDNTIAAFPDHRNTALIYYRLSEAYAKNGDADKAQYYFESARLVAPLAFEAKKAPVVSAVKAHPAQVAAPSKTPTTAKATSPVISIQVASFKSKENANRFVDRLSAEGFDAHVDAAQAAGGTVYRVKVGSFASKGDARDMITRLKARGYAIKVCTDDLCE